MCDTLGYSAPGRIRGGSDSSLLCFTVRIKGEMIEECLMIEIEIRNDILYGPKGAECVLRPGGEAGVVRDLREAAADRARRIRPG